VTTKKLRVCCRAAQDSCSQHAAQSLKRCSSVTPVPHISKYLYIVTTRASASATVHSCARCVHRSLFMLLSYVRGSVTNNIGFWIWWLDLLTPSFTISLNHNYNNSQSIFCRGLAPFSFFLIPLLRLTTLSVVLRCTPFYSKTLDSRSSTTILLQLLNSQFQFSNPLATNRLSLYSLGSDPIENTCHVLSRLRVY
jgi:hypothetical protein